MSALRVLVVEDEWLIRFMAAEFLRDEGYDVREAADGDQAALMLDGREPFDALFTDVQMPGGLDGIELATHARELYVTIPLLIVSGFAANLHARLSAFEPPIAFYNKPYMMEEVGHTLRELIEI